MTKVIAIVNQKGGVGKTTSTVNLAYALIQRGKRVLVVDMDPQASLTIYCGHNPRHLEREKRTIYWGLRKNGIPLEELLLPGEPSLIPTSLQLAKAEAEFVREWNQVNILLEALRPLKDRFGYILIDCPPTLTLLTINALTAADEVLIPVKTDYLSAGGILDILETIGEVRQRANPKLSILGVLPTMYNQRNSHDKEALQEMRDALGPHVKLFGPINRSTVFDRSAAEHTPTLQSMPNTPGVQNYYEIADHLIERGREDG